MADFLRELCNFGKKRLTSRFAARPFNTAHFRVRHFETCASLAISPDAQVFAVVLGLDNQRQCIELAHKVGATVENCECHPLFVPARSALYHDQSGVADQTMTTPYAAATTGTKASEAVAIIKAR